LHEKSLKGVGMEEYEGKEDRERERKESGGRLNRGKRE
jgi:hypothetical protein